MHAIFKIIFGAALGAAIGYGSAKFKLSNKKYVALCIAGLLAAVLVDYWLR